MFSEVFAVDSIFIHETWRKERDDLRRAALSISRSISRGSMACSLRSMREPTADKVISPSPSFSAAVVRALLAPKRKGRNAPFSLWRKERDSRLWRRAPVNSPPGCSVCALLFCSHSPRAQTARSTSGYALVRHGCGMLPQAGIPCSRRTLAPPPSNPSLYSFSGNGER